MHQLFFLLVGGNDPRRVGNMIVVHMGLEGPVHDGDGPHTHIH
jgi:hypothetical protein